MLNVDKISDSLEAQIRAYAMTRDTANQVQTLIGLGMSPEQAHTIAETLEVSVEEIAEEDE
jgi:hypothetical protein